MLGDKRSLAFCELKQLLERPWWKLRFPEALELQFQASLRLSAILQIRVVSLLGILLFMVSGALDHWLSAHGVSMVLWIRYVVVLPVLVALAMLPSIKMAHPYIEWFALIGVAIAGLGVLAIGAFTISPFNYLYYIGMMLIIVFGSTLIRLRFVMVALLNFWMLLAFVYCLVYKTPPTQLNVGIDVDIDAVVKALMSGYWVAMMSIAMFSAYLFERFGRHQFLQARMLEMETDELKVLGKKLHELSITDPLTELANRRHFESFAATQCHRAEKNRQPVAILLLDVDFFKPYNDHYGHQKGDLVLQRVAWVLRQHTKRGGEIAARYGGEEFILLIYGESQDEAVAHAESIRAGIEMMGLEHKFRSDDCAVVTVSIGVSVKIPASEDDWAAMTSAADQSLYRAKSEGRNRVVSTRSG